MANSQKVKIEQYSLSGELLSIFDSMKEAANISNTSQGSISNCCKNRNGQKTANGFVWKFQSQSI